MTIIKFLHKKLFSLLKVPFFQVILLFLTIGYPERFKTLFKVVKCVNALVRSKKIFQNTYLDISENTESNLIDTVLLYFFANVSYKNLQFVKNICHVFQVFVKNILKEKNYFTKKCFSMTYLEGRKDGGCPSRSK